MIVISGEGETTASDGESRRFKTGDVLLLEDTHGKGHISRSVNGATVIAVVQLDPWDEQSFSSSSVYTLPDSLVDS